MYLNLSGYHMTYDQEFSKGAVFDVSPDGSVEFQSLFTWGGRWIPSNNEAQFYSDKTMGLNPFAMNLGQVSITAQQSPPGFGSWGQPYVSGMMTTAQTFAQHGGYFEIRARVAGGQGLWPAFWMLPNTGQGYPELDVLEDPNLNASTEYWVHVTGNDNGGGDFMQTGKILSAGYHQYGVEWNDKTVTYYFDHVAIGEYGTPSNFAGVAMYMLINLAVGGQNSWPGAPGSGSLPAVYSIDYVRAFSTDPKMPQVQQQPMSSPDRAKTLPSYTPPVMPDVTTGAGADQLILNVSEDFFKADAQFTVDIDGVRQGKIFTTPASRAQGLVQNFVFNGNFGPGTHTVTVAFLNSENDGPYFQRNLYVQSATLNGLPVPGAQLVMTKKGKKAFTFTLPSNP